MSEISRAQKNRERYRLEGSLGYAIRIAKKISHKEITSLEELAKLVEDDFEGISTSLSFHCLNDLEIAGFEVGLFDDSIPTAPTASNQENKN